MGKGKKLIYYKNDRKEMIPLLPKQYSKVLEIGCGEGNFRQNLRLEHEYWAVEPDRLSAKIAEKKIDTVLFGTYEEMYNQIPDAYFDLVICNDVIEHLIDHDKFFQSIKNKIGKKGCLIASIPNVRYVKNLNELLIKKDWEYKSDGILDRTHLRFFTEKSLKRTISDNGFIADQFIGINPYKKKGFGLRRTLYNLAISLFGQDLRFMQFGICIRSME